MQVDQNLILKNDRHNETESLIKVERLKGNYDLGLKRKTAKTMKIYVWLKSKVVNEMMEEWREKR